ncbi:hypothetical protein [Streptomyces boluensis]|uniref:Uncharacterized protein n=1 Tax=Streptomyces boluensis TaxID=1775135 RepID=A0A964XJ63_9ACTN|nr:hypothetical protein [Streptomyces boluensis]NBE50964.1 hypothetical protein [Streptomyces boluensis]
MFVFRCRHCHGEVTGPVREVPLPDPNDALAPYQMGRDEPCPPRMPPGTFAYEPPRAEASALRPVNEWDAAVLYAKLGLTGVVLAREDLRDVEVTDKKGRTNGCCGLDGCDGPNLVCRRCRTEIGTEESDCWMAQQVTLIPTAVELVLPQRPEDT